MSIEEIIKLTLPVNSNRDHIQGPPAVPITLLEYGDYQCPGGAIVTLTIASAGLIGSGVIGTILSGGNITELKPNTQILEQFIIPISIFAAVLVIGLIAGGLTFLLNYLGYRKKDTNTIME